MSIALAIAFLGLVLLALRILASADRVIGWILMAAAVAGLLHPVVSGIARLVPRGIAVGLVALFSLGVAGAIGYQVVDELVTQTRVLQREAPRLARDVERNGPMADVAREIELSDRTRGFVDAVPERLRGGTPAEAIRAATTRGVALLAVSVLTVFFLLHAPGIARSAFLQIRDTDRRRRTEEIARAAYRRGFGYARGMAIMALGAGALAYTLAVATDAPGPAPLALWVALWDLVPLLGAVVGGASIVVLVAAESTTAGVAVALAFIGFQLLEALVLQPRIERSTVHVGPFVTVAAGFGGLEIYGLGGALLAVLGAAVAMAALDEWATRRAAAGATGEEGSRSDGSGTYRDMERVTNKHGPRVDEEMKQPHETRAQAFRRDEGPADDEQWSPAQEYRYDVEEEGEGVMPQLAAEERSDLARFLDPEAFPAHPAQLIESAQRHFAPDWVINRLESIPDRLYDTTEEVWEAMGGEHEERRA